MTDSKQQNGSSNKGEDVTKQIPFDDALRQIMKSPPKHRKGEKGDGGGAGKKKPTKAKSRKTR